MAKKKATKKKEPAKTEAAKTEKPAKTEEPAKKKEPATTIVLRRDCEVAGQPRQKGDQIGTVALAEGVSLNFLVDAVRFGVAGEEK